MKTISILFLVILVTGCAGASKKETDTLKKEVYDLKSTVGDLNWKLEELSNKFMLLQEQRTSDFETTEYNNTEDEVVVAKKKRSDSPPENLKVIKLGKKLKKETKPEIYIKREPKTAKGLYREGQDLFLSGQYRLARSKFASLAENFPFNDLADNSLYWGAESFYAEGLYEQALEIFTKIVNEYGEGNKAPDAMLKVAYTYIELGNIDKARSSLETLLERYPDTSAALKAKKRLKSL